MIIDTPSARLKDVDVFPSHRLFDFDPGFADGEFGQEDIASGDLKMIADGGIELGMRTASQYDNIADHGGDMASISSYF